MTKHNIIYLFTVGVLYVLTASCSGNGEPYFVKGSPESKYLRVSTNNISLGSNAGSQTFNITSNTDWQISCDASWLTISANRGSGNETISVSVKENTESKARHATITISYEGNKREIINVNQAGAEEKYLTIYHTSSTFEAGGGTLPLTITSNTSWTASTSESWITLSKYTGNGDSKINVTAQANPSTTQRQATITFSYGDKQNSIIVEQEGSIETDSVKSFAFGASGLLTYVSKYDLDFSGLDNVKAYIATGYDIASNELWLTNVNDVPAGTPILVIGPADKTIKVPEATSSITYYPENFLKGSATGISEVSAETDGYQNWILNEDGKFGKVLEGMTLEAGKAYLSLPKNFTSDLASNSQTISLPYGMLLYVSKYDLDFTDVKGLNAYTVTGFAKGGNVWLTPVQKASSNTPLLFVGEKDGKYSVPSTEVKMAYANMLEGSAFNASDLNELDSSLTPCILNRSNQFEPMSALILSIKNQLVPGEAYLPVLKDYAYDSVTNEPYETYNSMAEVISIKLDNKKTAK